jgi:hypothetical protein
MTCRDEILEALKFEGLVEFTPADVIGLLRARGSAYSPRTIRTHVVSRCCVNAPANHAVRYRDFERVQAGVYRLRES